MNGAEPTTEPPPLARRLWTLVAALSFTAATLFVYRPVLRDGPTSFTPTMPEVPRFGRIDISDHRYHVYLVNRGARALATNPFAYFSAQHCHPRKLSLTVGEPMLGMAVLALPAHLLTGDPELTYNAVLFEMTLLAAFAMFLLIRDWTGSAPAALAAGLLFAFPMVHLEDTSHAFAYDMSWTVLAMFFAGRLFAAGRWRDAVGLAAALAMQLWASLYPALGMALLGTPYAVWLVARHGLRQVKASQLALVAAAALAAAAFVYGPYLSMRGSGILFARSLQAFATWHFFLPGADFFFGWTCLLLGAAGLLLPRAAIHPGGLRVPRIAILIGGIVALAVALGPNAVPPLRLDLWAALARLLPGLENIRMVIRIFEAARAACCILAGLGFAGLLRSSGRARPAVAALLLAAVAAEVFAAWVPATGSKGGFLTYRTEPEPEQLRFFQELRRQGNDGPIFEWPHFRPDSVESIQIAPRRLSLATYHRRPVSSCYGSYLVDDELTPIAGAVPSPAALLMLQLRGFTTLLVHHGPDGGAHERARFDGLTTGERPLLRLLATSPTMTAYEMRVLEPAPPAGGRAGGGAVASHGPAS